jgi:CP family cyanate transporter-like MFS transporter
MDAMFRLIVASGQAAGPQAGAGVAPARHRALLLVALLLAGLSMRTAVTSVGAVLDSLQASLHMSAAVAGVLTTLPVICFALIGAATPRLARRLGPHGLMAGGLVTMTAGVLARAAVGVPWAFIVLSVPALAGGAVANVLMPSLVKQHFPDRIGQLTAAYTTALALGQALAVGLSVPVGSIAGGWRTGLGAWALLSAVAVVPWLAVLRRDPPARAAPDAGPPARRMLGSRTAWALTIMFASQSFQAYDMVGWFAKLMSSHGVDAGTAGAMVAVLGAVLIPVSLAVPLVPPRRHRTLAFGLGACSIVAYLGLWLAPVEGAWAWMVLAGTGGGMFPLVLTMIGLRSRVTATTASLSAFVQSIGYILAGSGPLLFGILHGATGSWDASLVSMMVALALSVAAAWSASTPRYVDDELARHAEAVL